MFEPIRSFTLVDLRAKELDHGYVVKIPRAEVDVAFDGTEWRFTLTVKPDTVTPYAWAEMEEMWEAACDASST